MNSGATVNVWLMIGQLARVWLFTFCYQDGPLSNALLCVVMTQSKSKSKRYSYDYPHYAVTTDIVIFTICERQLQLLLIRRKGNPYKGRWALPGGFLRPDEDLDACARRELQEESGVVASRLEQLGAFGARDRDPREQVVISIAYFALVRAGDVRLQASTDAAEACWHPFHPRKKLQSLAFDHDQIVDCAYDRLKRDLDDRLIAFDLLPTEFTLREAQEVYEIILNVGYSNEGDREGGLNRRNFYTRMVGSGRLVATGEMRREGRHRPAAVYRFAGAASGPMGKAKGPRPKRKK